MDVVHWLGCEGLLLGYCLKCAGCRERGGVRSEAAHRYEVKPGALSDLISHPAQCKNRGKNRGRDLGRSP